MRPWLSADSSRLRQGTPRSTKTSGQKGALSSQKSAGGRSSSAFRLLKNPGRRGSRRTWKCNRGGGPPVLHLGEFGWPDGRDITSSKGRGQIIAAFIPQPCAKRELMPYGTKSCRQNHTLADA